MLKLHSKWPNDAFRRYLIFGKKRFCFCELSQILSEKFVAFRQKSLGSFVKKAAFYVLRRTMRVGSFFRSIKCPYLYLDFEQKVFHLPLKVFGWSCRKSTRSFQMKVWREKIFSAISCDFQFFSEFLAEGLSIFLKIFRRRVVFENICFQSEQRIFWNTSFWESLTVGNFFGLSAEKKFLSKFSAGLSQVESIRPDERVERKLNSWEKTKNLFSGLSETTSDFVDKISSASSKRPPTHPAEHFEEIIFRERSCICFF